MIDLNNLEDSISEIFHTYYSDVYKFLICYSGEQNDAEDLTQEVFIRVLKSLQNFDYTCNLKTWIFSIAKHVAIDHYRKKKYTSIFKEGFFNQLKSTEIEPDEHVEKNELKDFVHYTISKLKPKYRVVVILRGINQLSIKETAEILNCSETNVKVDYHRALKELKKKFNMEMVEVLGNV